MQIRATVSAAELQEAARLARPPAFWLRFIAAYWYSTAICLTILVIAIYAIANHQHPRWAAMGIAFVTCAFFLGIAGIRWRTSLSRAAVLASSSSGILSLDADGLTTIPASGPSTFIPWSSYNKCTEGQSVFLLRGQNAATILPTDNTNRETIRAILAKKIK